MGYKRFFVLVIVMFLIFSSSSVSYLYGGKNENIKKWIIELSDRKERPMAKHMLIEAKGEATPELINALKGEYTKTSVKIDIIQIFKSNKDKEAIPVLKEVANSSNKRFRLASIRALGAMDDRNLTGIFKKATKDTYANVRLAAVSILIKLKDRSAVPDFIERLSDESVENRLKALDGLALFNDKSAIPALIERLNDKNITVVLKSIDMLSSFKDKPVVEALIKNLDAANRTIKIRTIETLAKIKDKTALPHLRALLNDEYIKVRRAAEYAVDAIKG